MHGPYSTDEARQRISVSLSSDRKVKGAGAFLSLFHETNTYTFWRLEKKFSPMGKGGKVLEI